MCPLCVEPPPFRFFLRAVVYSTKTHDFLLLLNFKRIQYHPELDLVNTLAALEVIKCKCLTISNLPINMKELGNLIYIFQEFLMNSILHGRSGETICSNNRLMFSQACRAVKGGFLVFQVAHRTNQVATAAMTSRKHR